MGMVLVMSACSKVEIEEQNYEVQKDGNVVLLYNNLESFTINLHEATLVDTPLVSDTLSADDVVIMSGLRYRVDNIKKIGIVKTIRNVNIVEKEIAVELSVPIRNDKTDARISTTFSFSREMTAVKRGERIEEKFCGFQFRVTPHLADYVEDTDGKNPYCLAVYDFDVEVLENAKPVGSFSFSRSFLVKRHEIRFLPTISDWEEGQTGTIQF